MTTYSLGSEDSELTRLELQADFLASGTRVLLGAAGLSAGMRVLDLGTGLGHVARAVADIVGPDGEVVGVDADVRMLEEARRRTPEGSPIRFEAGDVTSYREDRPFDAVVGRLILFHLPDPVAAVRHHLQAVNPGGRVVFLDFDLGGLHVDPSEPLTRRMIEVVIETFEAVGANPTIGAHLQDILGAAGVQDVGGFAFSQYRPADDPTGTAILTGVIRTLAPAIVAHGLATEAELDVPTLNARMTAALIEHGSTLLPPVLSGAWGRRP